MPKTNITLKIDRQLLKRIKVLAAQREISISALMTALLEEALTRNKKLDYEQAKQRALARMREGLDLGGRPLLRDDIYVR